MVLQNITPLILTYNEQANIGRALEKLTWAKQIIVLDSYSSDDTLSVARAYPNVSILHRHFDNFAAQCNFGLSKITTEWVLSLDADYICSDAFAKEIAALPPDPDVSGYVVRFKYCIMGQMLRGSLYPPRTALYRRKNARYTQDGHAHRVQVDGNVGRLSSYLYHDDRKSLQAWLKAQKRYARQEVIKLRTTPLTDLTLPDRLRRKRIIAPLLTPIFCLFVKGLVFNGRAGWYYSFQRTYAECLLSLYLLDYDLRQHVGPDNETADTQIMNAK